MSGFSYVLIRRGDLGGSAGLEGGQIACCHGDGLRILPSRLVVAPDLS